MANLKDIAYIIRSKNAGPFLITLDIFFKSKEIYERIKKRDIINIKKISELFKVPKEVIVGIYHIDDINAIKITLRRLIPSGSIFDKDIYGAQQHYPLLRIEIPEDIIE